MLEPHFKNGQSLHIVWRELAVETESERQVADCAQGTGYAAKEFRSGCVARKVRYEISSPTRGNDATITRFELLD